MDELNHRGLHWQMDVGFFSERVIISEFISYQFHRTDLMGARRSIIICYPFIDVVTYRFRISRTPKAALIKACTARSPKTQVMKSGCLSSLRGWKA